ncbi:PREDICTED: uncharacterized protein LOC106811707 isoform X2 [Priapulus caudatus]|uniref:DNA (cytosine-5-)-methyltransferase n=1 Tax=Priapulus caudatus TaxID=37621 RepID=A0ABM1EFC6_PRICU|nr:PREDICTED: uncharacterized protein LOC106811707 isoform X2 [Priapulus caudatus]
MYQYLWNDISSGLNLSAQVITESIRTLVSNSVALSEEPIIHGETYASNSASTAMNKYLEWIRYKEPMDVNNNSSAGSSRSFVLVENTLIAQGNSTDSSNRVAEQVLSDSPTVLDSNVVADLTSVHGGERQQPVVLTGALSAAEHELSMEISQNALLKKKKNMLQSPRKRRRCTRTDTPASEVNVMWRRQSSRLVNQRVKKELTEASSIDNCAAALSGNEGPWKRQSDVALGENWSLTVINDTRPEECEAKSKSVMARQEAETKIGEGSTMTEVLMAESVPQKTYMNVGRAAKGNVRVCSEVAKDDMKEVANENLTVCIPTNGQSNSENLDCYSVAGYCENFQTMDIDNNSCAGFSGLLAIVENTLTSQGNITEGSSQVVEQVLSDSPTVSDSNVVADFTSVHSGECQQPVVGTSPVAQKCVTDMEASPKKSEPYLKTRGEDIEARPMMLTGGLDEPEAELSMEVSQSVPSKKRKMMRQSPRKRRRCTRTDTPASEVNVMWRRQSSRLVNQRVKKELTEASSIDNCAAAFLGNEEQWKRQSDVASGSDWSLTVINDTRPEECEVKSKSVMARQEAETKIDEGSTMTEIMMAESVSRKTYMNVGNAAKRNVNVCSGMATDELEQVQHESSTVCILKKDHCRKDNLTVIDETARQVVGMSEAEDDQICELDPRQLDCVFYVRGMYGDESSDKLPDGPPRCSDVCDSYVEWVPIAHQEGSQLPMLSASVKCAKLPQQVQRSDEGASKHGRAGNLGEGIEPEGNSVLSSPSLPVPDGGISEWRYQVNTLIEDCGIADQSCLDVAQRATVGKLFDYETEEFSSQEDVVAPDISTTELLPNEFNLVSTVSVGPDVDLTSANLIGCPEITSEEGDAVHLEQHHVDGGREGSENPLMMHTVEAFTSDKIKSLFNDANSMCMEANEQGDWLFSRQDVSAHHTDTIELTPEEVSSVGANSSELVNLQRSLSQDYNDFDSSCPLANSKINPDSCDWEITDDNSTCHEKHGVYILDDDQTDQSSLVSSFSETMNLLKSLTENSIQTRDATHALFFSESEVARNPLSQGVPIESSHEGHHVNTRYVFCAQDIESAVETAYRRPPHPVLSTVAMVTCQDLEQSDAATVTMSPSQDTEHCDVSSVTMLTSQDTEQSHVTTVTILTSQDTEQSDVTNVTMLTSQDTEQPDVSSVNKLTPQDTEQSDVTTVAMLTYQDTEQSDVSSVNKLTPQDTGQPNVTTVTMLTSQDTEKSDVTTVTMLTPQDKEQSDVTGVTKLISQDTEMPDVTTVTMLTSQDTEQSHVSSVNKLTSQDTEQPNMSPVTSFTSKPLQQSNIDCISIVTSEFQEQPDTASMRIFASQDREESGSVCFSRDGSQCLTESSTSSCHGSSLVWSPSVVSTIRGTLHRDILTEHNDVSFIKGSEVCDAVAKGESLHLGSYGALEKSVNDEMERESERESSISGSRREEVTSPECIQVQQQEDDASDSISEETNTAEVPDFKRVLAASQIGVHDGGHCGVSLPLRDSALNRVTENNSDGEPLGNTHFLCERVDEGSVWLTPRGDINHAAGHNSDTWWSFASSSVCSTGLVVDQKNSLMGCNTDQSHIQHVIPTRGTDLNHDIALGNIINVESGLNTLPMDKQKDIMLSLWEGEGNKSHIENGEEASTCVTATRSTMGETNSEIVKYDAKGTVTTDKVEESSISQSMLKQLPLPTTSPALSDIIYASEYAEGGVAKWYSVNLCHHDLTDTSDDCKAAHERGCEQVDSCNVVRQLSFDQEESAGSVCDTTQDSLSDVTPSEVLLIQASCESGAQNVPVGSDEATVSGSADVTCQKSKSAGRDSRTVTRPGNKAPLFTPKKSTQPNETKCNKRSVDDIVLPLAKRRYSSLDMNPPCTPCAVSTPFSDPSNLNDVEPGDYLMEMVESPRRITRAMLAAARPKLVTKSPCISHKHVSVAAATGVRSRSEDTTTLAPSVAKVGSPAKSLSPSASIRPLSPHWIRSTSSSIESDVESTVSPKACLAPNTIATPPKKISEQMSASALRYKGVESSSAHVPPSTPANINVGAFIWAKLGSHPWWPALVVSHRDCAQCPARFNSTWVYWFGDHNVSEMPCYKLSDFVSDFQFKYSRTIKRHYHQSIDEILQACKLRVTSPDTTLDEDNLIEWAEGSFGGLDSSSFDPPSGSMAVPASVQPYLTLVREKADDSRGRCTESAKDECMTEEDIQLLERIRNGDMSIEDICISCCQGEVMLVDQHPLFHGGVCQACKEELLETLLAHGDDSANVYCVVCGYAGELYVCDNFECSRVYCLSCIEVLIGDAHAETVRSASPWSCFMCEDVQEGLLHPRSDWQQRLVKFFQVETHVMGEIDPSCFVEKRPIRVLSLFDGIGTGKFALDQLGLEVETYFASEVDQDAVNVVSIHYGNKVQQIGDISSIPSCKIASLCPIDLLIGGSPCNDLSLVNPSRKGIYGGSGVLFFEFYRILKCIQQSNPSNRHLFWLYENVVTMPADCKATISKFLECEPAMWDAQLFSAQKRARYFWGNIPGLYSHAPLHVEERGEASSISEILTSSCNRKAVVKKVRTITTRPNSLRQGKQEKLFPVQMNGVGDTLWSTELERLFGFPDHYTDVGNLSVGQRQKLLGKAWSVPVIHHLLKPIAKFYMSTEQSDIMATSDTAMEQQSSDISVPTSSGNSVLSPLSNTAVAAASTYEVEKPPTDSL